LSRETDTAFAAGPQMLTPGDRGRHK